MISYSPNPLTVTCHCNDLFAHVLIEHTFKNETGNSLNCAIIFQLQDEIIFKSFNAKIDSSLEINSKVVDKEWAIKNHGDTNIPVGYTTISGFQCLDVGNLNQNEILTFKLYLIVPIRSEDNLFKFSFSPSHFPYIINKNNSTRYNYPKSIEFKMDIKSNSNGKIGNVVSNVYDIAPQYSIDSRTASLYISNDEMIKQNFDTIGISFTEENINVLKLYEEYDPIINVYSYYLSCVFNINDNLIDFFRKGDQTNNFTNIKGTVEDTNISAGVFILLLDQSGSMCGEKIKIAKDSLRIFLKSLPVGSYFDLIGFGCKFEVYTEAPLLSNEKNLEFADKLIQTLDANLGGTNIYDPLKYIFNKIYDKNLAKNVFVITDGQVENPQACYDLIKRNLFRVHSIGIGSEVDVNLVEGLGRTGEGKALFSSNVKNLTQLIITAMNCAIKPYLNSIKVTFDDKNIHDEFLLEYPTAKSLIYDGERYSFSFISKNRIT
jgi:hypothetical protein